ncbi:hypothetical protein ES703_84374 [subsurface metagenome]
MTEKEAREIWDDAEGFLREDFLIGVERMYFLTEDLVDSFQSSISETKWHELPVELKNMLTNYFEDFEQICRLSMKDWWMMLDTNERHTMLASWAAEEQNRGKVSAQTLRDITQVEWDKLGQDVKSIIEEVRESTEVRIFSKSMMITELFDFKSKDDMIIYEKIFYTGCKFSEAAFSSNDPMKENIIEVLQELMIKLSKVVDEIRTFQLNKLACERKLIVELPNGVSAVSTIELGKNIENFLTQSIGTLDIFATQFLKKMFGYSHHDWSNKEIIRHLNKQQHLCNEAVQSIG